MTSAWLTSSEGAWCLGGLGPARPQVADAVGTQQLAAGMHYLPAAVTQGPCQQVTSQQMADDLSAPQRRPGGPTRQNRRRAQTNLRKWGQARRGMRPASCVSIASYSLFRRDAGLSLEADVDRPGSARV